MKVYLVIRTFAYDQGYEIVGAFSKREKADKCFARQSHLDKQSIRGMMTDLDVEEVEIY